MPPRPRFTSLQAIFILLMGLVLLLGLALTGWWFWQQRQARETGAFVRLSNVGKSQYEQGNAPGAIQALERALALQPGQPQAQLNLASASLLGEQPDRALGLARQVLLNDPGSAAAHYIAGCAHLRLRHFEEAVKALQQAKQIDPTINAVSFQLGLAEEGMGRLEEAAEQWREVIQFEPEHPAAHYRLAQVLLRLGQKEEAATALQAHQKIQAGQSQPATPGTFERSKYTQIEVPAPPELPARDGVTVKFTDVTDSVLPNAANFSGPVALIDFRQNGTNDLILREPGQGFRLAVNGGGKFRPENDLWPAPAERYAQTLVGDLNNDGVPDVLVLGPTSSHLFRLNTNGAARDMTVSAGLKNLRAEQGVLVDLDFRGQLDLVYLAPPERTPRVLRNLGNLYFTEFTTNSGLPLTPGAAAQLVLEDSNHDDLLDLFVIRSNQPASLFLKQRGGALTLTNRSGLPEARLVAAGDLNNNGRADFVLVRGKKLEVHFSGLNVTNLSFDLGTFSPTTLRLLDYDNDGWLDIVAAGSGFRVWRNLGRGRFEDRTTRLGLDRTQMAVESFAAGDIDQDGDTDWIIGLATGGVRVLRNEGGNANRQLKLVLQGRRSNASGYGVRVEVVAGGLRVVRRVFDQPVEIGVGRHEKLDSVNVRWSNLSPGFLDVKPDARRPLVVTELTIQEGSCPYLFTWDGSGFRFVSDILGAAPLGLPFAEGKYIEADPDELLWLGNSRTVQPRNGAYVVQITEELREVLYLDQARLLVADHARDTEVFTTHKMLPRKPYPPAEIATLRNPRAPTRAVRHDGLDVTAALRTRDGEMASPAEIRSPQIRGLAQPWSVTLEFPDLAMEPTPVLALTGWIRYGGGMGNIAAAVHPDLPFPFPTLEVETLSGWRILDVTVGTPAGKTKTILVDLTGKLPRDAQRLRLSTAFEIHWDRAALYTRGDAASSKQHWIQPATADLHWRGYSALANLPATQPFTPIYSEVHSAPLWTITPAGWCTRYGDVRELVLSKDNGLVVLNGGDELTLHFPIASLPPVAPGQEREFFLFVSGWDKDADFHVATGSQVEPLPWHGMIDQLLGVERRPRFTNDAWITQYNTRWVGQRTFARKPGRETQAAR